MIEVIALIFRADFWITDFFACDKFTSPTGQEVEIANQEHRNM